jgi:hypothetical protein
MDRGSEADNHQGDNMTTALATVNQTPSASLAFEPSDIESAFNLAGLLVRSKLLPRSLSTPEAAFTVIMAGRELGLTAMQSLRSLHVIEGKPVMSADLMMALCLRSPICDHFRLVESTDTKATFEAKRTGQDAVRLSFTIDQAKAAGLVGKDNWKKFPAAMLRARCVAALARIVFADLMLGIYDTDEIGPKENRIPEQVQVEVVTGDFGDEADDGKPSPVDAALIEFARAESLEALGKARSDFGALKLRLDDETKATLRAAYDEASKRLAQPAPASVEAA